MEQEILKLEALELDAIRKINQEINHLNASIVQAERQKFDLISALVQVEAKRNQIIGGKLELHGYSGRDAYADLETGVITIQ